MENFVVSAAAANVKRKRTTHPPDRIQRAVTLARQVGAFAATSEIRKFLPDDDSITEETVRTWLFRWRKEGEFWDKSGKRGRPAITSSIPGAQDEWRRQVDSFRSQGASVTGRLSSTIMRAVIAEKAPSLLERNGGMVKMSVRSGQNILKSDGKSFRKRTSTHIIPPTENVADARDSFFQKLADCWPNQVVDRSLLINFDQTFHQYNPNRGYTWEKKGADRVQLINDKDGFTLLPVVSSVGPIGAQMIFSGKTTGSLPTVTPGPLLRFTQTGNHWSNETTTLDLWTHIILPYVAKRRRELGNETAPAIVLADAFAAHWTPAVLRLAETANFIAYICIPECLTHLFQPLDLGIIAAIKHSVLRRKDEFAESEVRTAIRENRPVILNKSRPVVRDRVTTYIKETLQDPLICAENCCRSGFDRAGITRVLYGDNVQADVDNFVAPVVCTECGESALPGVTAPQCSCFADDDVATLCSGCFAMHNELCPAR